MRNLILAAGTLVSSIALGQCDLRYTYNPFGSCMGRVETACGDSVVWSNGQTGPTATDLAPGTYSYQVYSNGELVQEVTDVEVVQKAWSISNLHPDLMGSGPTISGWAEVPDCCDSHWYFLCCSPEDSLSYARLVQDGTTEITVEPCMGCDVQPGLPTLGGMFWFGNVPTGHTYTVRIYDSCGNVTDDTTEIVLNACDNLNLEVETSGAQPGGLMGEVDLLAAVPDTTEPYPLHAPVTGTATLYRGLGGTDIVGSYTGVASAAWTGLDTGYYRVEFIPDAGCNRVVKTVHLSTTTGLGEYAPTPTFQLVPGQDPDQIMVRAQGGVATHIEMVGTLGQRVPVRGLGNGLYDISTVPPGLYLVSVKVGGAVLSGKFLRP